MTKNTVDTDQLKIVAILILIMLVNALTVYSVFSAGHDWRGDFGLYVSQAQAILNGSVQELYEMNKFSMDNSTDNLGPYLYPFGFPVLLAPILALFGLNFFALKGLCAAGLVLSIPLVYRLIRNHFNSAFIPFLIVLSVAFHASYVVFADSVLSDLPFLFFSFLVLVHMRKRPTWINQVLMGLLIYFSYMIRDIGIVLIPTLLVCQLYKPVTLENIRWKKLLLLTPHLIFGVLVLTSNIVLPSGQENHLRALFTEISYKSIVQNTDYYQSLITQFFYLGEHPTLLFYLPFILMVLGAVSVFRRTPHLVIYVLLSLLILILWPYKQGVRFLFPILPFLLLFAVKGVSIVFARLDSVKKLEPVLILSIALYLGYFNIREINEYAKRDTNICYTEEMREVYAFISNEIPNDRIVGSYYPRIFRLFTGVNSIRISQYGFDLTTKADYYLGSKQYTDKNVIRKYTVVFETENEILLSKKKNKPYTLQKQSVRIY